MERVSDRGAARDAASATWSRAARDAAPVVVFYVAFGALFGVLATRAGWSPAAAMLSSVFVYSGAAQLALVGLLHAHATAVAVIATVAILSLRHLTFAAAVAPHAAALSPALRMLVAFGLTDEAFGLTAARWAKSGADLRYLVGVEALLWPAWWLGTGLGVALAYRFAALGIGGFSGWQVAFPALFIGLALPLARGSRWRVAVIAAGLAWLLDQLLPSGAALLVAALLAPLVEVARARD